MSFENQQTKVLEMVENRKQEYRDIVIHIDNYLKRASVEDINIFFSLLCDIKHVTSEEKTDLMKLFVIVNNVVSFLSKHNDSLYTIKALENQLELHALQTVYESHKDFPNWGALKSYLFNIDGFDDEYSKQNEDVIKLFNMTAKRIVSILKHYSIDKLVENPQIIELLDRIEAKNLNDEDKIKTSILHVINRIKYSNTLNAQSENNLFSEIDDNLEYIKAKEDPFTYNILNGLTEKNKETFFKGVDSYVNQFLISKNKKRPINALLLDHQIELFFHDNFSQYNLFDGCLIQLLILHYDREIFFEFMERYKVPFNIPIHMANYSFDEDDKDKIENSYVSINEYASTINSPLTRDLKLAGINVWEYFSHDVVIKDSIYSYNYSPDTLNSQLSQQTLCHMIEMGVIDQSLTFKGGNIFYELLDNHAYIPFVSLYKKLKNENPKFNLKDFNHKDFDLMRFYFETKDSNNIEKPLIEIFIQENFDLTYDSNGPSPLSSLVANNSETDYLIQVLSLLEPLFPDDYRRRQPFDSLEKEVTHKIFQPMATWYDENEMANHLKKSTGGRVAILENILQKNNPEKPLLRVEDESFFSELEMKLPNFKEVINFYKGQFRQNYYSNKKRISPVLLLGDPGIGKTYFSKELAQRLNTGYSFIDMGSLTSSWILSGASGTWQDAKQGKILDLMIKSPTFNPIVLLDELDKTGGGRYDPSVVLYQLLEEINAQEFVDEFVDFQFDMSGIIYIACANSINNLSDPLLSRFKVFNVPSPNAEQLELIIQNIYKETTKNNPLLKPEIDIHLLSTLKNNSLREVKTIIEEGVTNALLEHSRADLNKMIVNRETVSLNEQHFKPKQLKISMGF